MQNEGLTENGEKKRTKKRGNRFNQKKLHQHEEGVPFFLSSDPPQECFKLSEGTLHDP